MVLSCKNNKHQNPRRVSEWGLRAFWEELIDTGEEGKKKRRKEGANGGMKEGRKERRRKIFKQLSSTLKKGDT